MSESCNGNNTLEKGAMAAAMEPIRGRIVTGPGGQVVFRHTSMRATPNLRWAQMNVFQGKWKVPDGPPRLQQMWMDPDVGDHQWRDVPTVEVDYKGDGPIVSV